MGCCGRYQQPSQCLGAISESCFDNGIPSRVDFLASFPEQEAAEPHQTGSQILLYELNLLHAKIKSRLGDKPIWTVRERFKRGVNWFEAQGRRAKKRNERY